MKLTEKIGICLIGAAVFFALLFVISPESAESLERLYGAILGFFRGLFGSSAYITVYAAAQLIARQIPPIPPI